MFTDRNLEVKGGNTRLKKQSLGKLFHIKEKLDLYDIWQIQILLGRNISLVLFKDVFIQSLHVCLAEFSGNS